MRQLASIPDRHPHRRRRALLGGFLVLAALAVSCAPRQERDSEAGTTGSTPLEGEAVDALRQGRPFNVVIVTLDTTRADHIGAYGAGDVTTPAIDALAAEGVLFRRAYSPVPLTLPAHASLFTGLNPYDHGVRDNTGFAVPDELTTLAEVLRDNGYRTAAFVASYVLAPVWNLDQGFETYVDGLDAQDRRAEVMSQAQRPADEVVDDAVAWLRRYRADRGGRSQQPFLLWVHLYDAHTPYAPPEPFRTRYIDNAYAGEIAFMDSQVARLVQELRTTGAGDDAVIVVAGDHGESLGEHGELEHGFFVYEPATRVPLIVSAPGAAPRGVERDAIVSLVDVLPTVLDVNGIAPPAGVAGRSLLPLLLATDAGADRVVYGETFYPRLHYGWSELTAVQDQRYKLILSSAPELYDLLEDPGETTNLMGRLDEVHERLEDEAERLLADARAPDARVEIDAATRRTLEGLGYVAGPAAAGSGPRAAPRDKIEQFNRSLRARSLMAQGDLEGAARLYDEILDDDPEVLIAYERLGEIYMLQGRFARAAETFSFAVPLRPDWHEIYVKLAEAQIALGRPDEAEQTLLGSLQLVTPHPSIHCMLGYVNELETDYGAALQHYRSCRELDDGSPEPLVYLARVHLQMGDATSAEQNARAALELDAGARGAHYVLAQVSAERGDDRRAFAEYQAEVESSPDHVDAHFGLAMMHGEAGRSAEEERHLERILQIEPSHPLAALFLANILLESGRDYERAVDLVTAALQQPLQREDLAAGYYMLSNLHQRLGNPELAAQYLRRAQELGREQ